MVALCVCVCVLVSEAEHLSLFLPPSPPAVLLRRTQRDLSLQHSWAETSLSVPQLNGT